VQLPGEQTEWGFMTYGGSGNERQSKNARREVAREKARTLREEQRKRERRNRFFLQGGIGIGILAILVVVAIVVVGNIKPPSPGPVNMASDGITIGKDFKAVRTAAIPANGKPTPTVRDKTSSVVTIRIYLDYFCPICNEFETANKTQLSAWMKSGAATLEIHPISFLDRSSLGTQYSTRAANAAGCVATYAPDDFWAWTQEMYVKQPAEGTVGLTNTQIIGVMKTAKVSDIAKITPCVDNETYKGWVADATTRATTGPLPDSNVKTVTGTPTVIVDGQSYSATDWTSAADFQAFVLKAAGAGFNSGSTSTPTPAPTTTPTPTATK
jgi:protein-disulfide isomerase